MLPTLALSTSPLAAQDEPASAMPSPQLQAELSAKGPSTEECMDYLLYLLSKSPESDLQRKQGIRDSLDYLYKNKLEESRPLIDQMQIWQHSEHFLEAIPSYFLDELLRYQWPVAEASLLSALDKLHSMNPTDNNDMIDCAAGIPMGKIMILLEPYIKEKHRQRLRQYSQSNDLELAQAAYRSLLILDKLPQPTLSNLVEKTWGVSNLEQLQALDESRRREAELIAADEGARSGVFAPWVDADLLCRASAAMFEMGLYRQAIALNNFIDKKNMQITQGEQLNAAVENYRLIPGPGLRLKLSTRIYTIPELFIP